MRIIFSLFYCQQTDDILENLAKGLLSLTILTWLFSTMRRSQYCRTSPSSLGNKYSELSGTGELSLNVVLRRTFHTHWTRTVNGHTGTDSVSQLSSPAQLQHLAVNIWIINTEPRSTLGNVGESYCSRLVREMRAVYVDLDHVKQAEGIKNITNKEEIWQYNILTFGTYHLGLFLKKWWKLKLIWFTFSCSISCVMCSDWWTAGTWWDGFKGFGLNVFSGLSSHPEVRTVEWNTSEMPTGPI